VSSALSANLLDTGCAAESKIKLQCKREPNDKIQNGDVMTLPQYEIFALRYGTMAKRSRRENFITQDPHDEPMPMDYFVWVVRNAERTILVDTGFSARQAKERGRTLLALSDRIPLACLGIAPGDIQDVVLTHLHYDHAGNIDLYCPMRGFTFRTGRWTMPAAAICVTACSATRTTWKMWFP
jgi:ribonuclease BN (tRNA processing enzyme)